MPLQRLQSLEAYAYTLDPEFANLRRRRVDFFVSVKIDLWGLKSRDTEMSILLIHSSPVWCIMAIIN